MPPSANLSPAGLQRWAKRPPRTFAEAAGGARRVAEHRPHRLGVGVGQRALDGVPPGSGDGRRLVAEGRRRGGPVCRPAMSRCSASYQVNGIDLGQSLSRPARLLERLAGVGETRLVSALACHLASSCQVLVRSWPSVVALTTPPYLRSVDIAHQDEARRPSPTCRAVRLRRWRRAPLAAGCSEKFRRAGRCPILTRYLALHSACPVSQASGVCGCPGKAT